MAKLLVKEKQIENLILSYLKMNGIFAWKNESVGVFDRAKGVYRRKAGIHRMVGVSDILGIHNGRILAIEVKSKTGKLSPDQEIFLSEIVLRGGIAFMARSLEDVTYQLNEFGVAL